MEVKFNKIEEAVTVLSSHPDGKKFLVNNVVVELVGFETTVMDHYYVVRKLRHQCTVNNVKKYKRTKELTTITACAPLFYIDQKEIIITK